MRFAALFRVSGFIVFGLGAAACENDDSAASEPAAAAEYDAEKTESSDVGPHANDELEQARWSAEAFVTVWRIDEEEKLSLPLVDSGTYDFTVRWGGRDIPSADILVQNC